jgi:predicted SAM-dependent methyltransferase
MSILHLGLRVLNVFLKKPNGRQLYIGPPPPPPPHLSFQEIKKLDYIFLYAGDIPENKNYNKIGLSITRNDSDHIKHDITKIHDIDDNSVDIYQAEDVFEHIEYDKLEPVIMEIHRILKPGGLFRLSVPDYRCDILSNRSVKSGDGTILFDPGGEGTFLESTGQVINGGHVWFPVYEKVKELVEKAPFAKIDFLQYYDEKGVARCNKIDYNKGYIQRTPDHDARVKNPYRPLSIVVDCYKRRSGLENWFV